MSLGLLITLGDECAGLWRYYLERPCCWVGEARYNLGRRRLASDRTIASA